MSEIKDIKIKEIEDFLETQQPTVKDEEYGEMYILWTGFAWEYLQRLMIERQQLLDELKRCRALMGDVLMESNGIDDNVWTLSDGSKVEWDYPIYSFANAINKMDKYCTQLDEHIEKLTQ